MTRVFVERYRSGRNGVDSKSTCPVKSGARGFESHPLRHARYAGPPQNRGPDIKAKIDDYGEMSELAEGARLEIACATKKWHRGFESLSLRHL